MKASFLTKETVLGHGIRDRQFPKFNVGDTISVAQNIKEGEKYRIQMYQGVVISIHNNGIASTFTVRKISHNGIGVEKIFPYYTPMIDHIKLIKRGVVRRAKLYYLRGRVGKNTKIREKLESKGDVVQNTDLEVETQSVESSADASVMEKEKGVENK